MGNRIEVLGGAGQETPERAAVNLRMVWELLHDSQWQLPSSDVEAQWKDALGESAVMQVRLPAEFSNLAQNLQSIIHTAGIGPASVLSTKHQ